MQLNTDHPLTRALIPLPVCALAGMGFYMLWGALGIADATESAWWIGRKSGWRLFFSLWPFVTIYLASAALTLFKANTGGRWAGLGLTLWSSAAWFGAFAIGAATGKWFGVQAAAFIALLLILAIYFWWTVYRKISTLEPGSLKPAIWAGVLFLVMLIPLSGWINRAISTTGDEQIYLIHAQSFIQDGDFDTTNQAENKAYSGYYWGNWSKTFQNKPFRCFPLLLAPAMALGGRLGVLIFFSLAAAITAWACCRMMLRLTRSPGAAWAASGLMGVSLAFTLPALQVYPEVIAACAMSLCMLLIMEDKHKSIWGVLAIALLVVLVSSLKTRFFPAMSTILIIALWRRNKWHLAACAAGALGLAAALYLFKPESIQHIVSLLRYKFNMLSLDPWELLRSAAGIFLDQEVGLVFYSPALLLALPGLIILYRRNRSMFTIALLPSMVMVIEICILASGYWDAGFTIPGRFLIVVTPCLALPIAMALHRGRHWLLHSWAIMLGLISLAIMFACYLSPELLHARLIGSNRILLLIQNLIQIDIARFFPTLTSTYPFTGWQGSFQHADLITIALLIASAWLWVWLGNGRSEKGSASNLRPALIGTGLACLIVGAGIYAAGKWLPDTNLRGPDFQASNSTLYRPITSHPFTMLAMRPGAKAWREVRLQGGETTLEVHTNMVHQKVKRMLRKNKYDPVLKVSMAGKDLAELRLLDLPACQGFRPRYRTQIGRVSFEAPAGRHVLQVEYIRGGRLPGHFVGLDLVAISRD